MPEPDHPASSVPVPSGDAARLRLWQHQKGDTYRVIVASGMAGPWGSGISYEIDEAEFPKLESAIHHGFSEHDRSDDFNIGAYRKGKLTAVLWMMEIVDDEPDVLAAVEAGWSGS